MSAPLGKQLRVAALVTEYRPGSHADVLLTKFLKGFPLDDGFHPPRVQLAGIYFDQCPKNEIGHALAAEHGVTVFDTIHQCLTLGGSHSSNEPDSKDEIAVDGVIIVGEHGDYAWNEKDQHLYPRKYFMEQACGVISKSKRAVPIFNDKHLSYNWHDAKWMVDRARELGVPFMAGSSLVFAWRKPWLEHPLGVRLQTAIAIGYSGLDIYGFHALEALQCMVERRAGGEVGLAAVQCLEGQDVWDACARGFIDMEVAEQACATIENKPEGGIIANTPEPAAFLLEYRDGFRATVLMLNGYVSAQAYAARLEETGEICACSMSLKEGCPYGDPPYRPAEGTFAHFAYMGRNFEECVVTGKATYPVERCLLTTGALEAALTSRFEGHRRLPTPWLDVEYTSYESLAIRPTAPAPEGASLMSWPPPPTPGAATAAGGGGGVVGGSYSAGRAAAADAAKL